MKRSALQYYEKLTIAFFGSKFRGAWFLWVIFLTENEMVVVIKSIDRLHDKGLRSFSLDLLCQMLRILGRIYTPFGLDNFALTPYCPGLLGNRDRRLLAYFKWLTFIGYRNVVPRAN